ncbi:helix-turn-helix transcriptional regulator [Delftia tsuruhatensis]|uniref:helix-turn-helix transcriptional regulator n=1 Tax=Delftia tsuruhatensis TaxID=180282 RepID=UPI0020901426|nr:WYL domain-containing protein [Delftia tsuruhatensis]MCO5340553.1 WYL domain-containing protein [Delftia tsuruhatensis]MCR4547888.1 WYL domain-containing protein [Delftia tsuruhatensis]
MDNQTPSPDTSSNGKPGVSWGLDRRLQFIDFRLRWEGRLNRTDLIEYFGISMPQASLDIARYLELAPSNLEYDRRSRTYVAGASFKPLFPRSSARRYLAELHAKTTGLLEQGASFIGHAPAVDTAPSPWRAVSDEVVHAVIRAIQDKAAVEVLYQSMTSVDASSRTISPHALGFDGFRWHVRAYCHKRGRFSDFVLARILGLKVAGPSSVDPGTDALWHTILTLVLVPHPDLSAAKKRVIELDYCMEDGQVALECRQAFLFYTMRRLGLHTETPSDPAAQQISLGNRTELQPYIDALTASN